jgi:UrcA family protein
MNSLNIIRHVMTAAIVGTLVSGFAIPAGAADATDARSITAKFGDLNVSSPDGAAALYGRIRSAAKTVCLPAQSNSDPFKSEFNTCLHKAIADAVTKVNRMELYTVYNQHNTPALPTGLLSQQR